MENELVVQVSMKHEIELAMKLLEKDIHEKQDTLIGLRQQLDEVKAINVEMYQKLQVKGQSAERITESNKCIITILVSWVLLFPGVLVALCFLGQLDILEHYLCKHGFIQRTSYGSYLQDLGKKRARG